MINIHKRDIALGLLSLPEQRKRGNEEAAESNHSVVIPSLCAASSSPKGLGVTCCDKKAVETWKSGEDVLV